MDTIEKTGGMGRALAERDRNAEQMEVTVVTPSLRDEVNVRHRRGRNVIHLWVTEREPEYRVAVAMLTPTEARKLAVALRTAASRVDGGDTGRTAR